MSGRCSPAKALALLGPDFSPMAAADEMTQAIQTNSSFRLWCDGVLIKPHIAAIAKVVPTLEPDGRWIADIESTGPGLGWARGLPWELEIDEVMALRPQPDTRAEAMQTAATAATAAAEAAEAARAEAATARAELEQARAALQAATEKMEKAEARAQAAEARAEAIASETTTKPDPEPEPRRRPGPKPGYPLWRLEAAAFTHQFFIEKKRGPSAGEVAEHLQIKYDGWEPPDSDIRALLRFLIHD
jgi:hypothetical protein